MRGLLLQGLIRLLLPLLVAVAFYRLTMRFTDWPAWATMGTFLMTGYAAHLCVKPYASNQLIWAHAAWIIVRLTTVAVIVCLTFGAAYALSTAPVASLLDSVSGWIDPKKHLQTGRWVFASICAVIAYVKAKNANLPSKYDPTVRGRRLLSFDDARERHKALVTDGDPGLYNWGGLMLRERVATTHFLVAGATGSGKTLTLRMLMKSVVEQRRVRPNTRLLVYDAKQDVVSSLIMMGVPSDDIRILNPFDGRCFAWDMAADITEPAEAQQVASILIPTDNDVNRFFTDAVRDVLTGVFTSFMQSGRHWTLRDVVLAMYSDRDTLRAILLSGTNGSRFDAYFTDRRSYSNIKATINTKMAPYSIVAAAWEGRPTLSLVEWLRSRYVLVLGNHEACRSALDAINQVMFKRLTELVLTMPEVADDAEDPTRIWIFLDEVREAGRLDGLPRLLTKGRSKGACVVLGFQDIEGMREVYGKQVAHELAGQCACKAVLRLENPSAAEWASSLFGVSETELWSHSYGQYSSSSVSIGNRALVMPSQLMDIAPTNPTNGMGGYYLVPDVGAYYHLHTSQIIDQALPAPPRRNRAGLSREDFRHRTGDYQTLRDWTAAEVTAWGGCENNQDEDPPDDNDDETAPRRRMRTPTE